MKHKIYIGGLVILCICSAIVFASVDSAPPAIPVEYWGQVTFDGALATDGLAVTAEVGSVDHAQASTTSGGYYDVILINGDRPLTYEDDPTCSTHWGAGEACVPCNLAIPGDCVEGPKDGEIVRIKVNADEVMPALDWSEGNVDEVDIVWPIGDWNKDGCTDMGDFVGPFADNYGIACPLTHPIPLCLIFNLNIDAMVDMGDFVGPFADNYGGGC